MVFVGCPLDRGLGVVGPNGDFLVGDGAVEANGSCNPWIAIP